jgi:hypothetical protein
LTSEALSAPAQTPTADLSDQGAPASLAEATPVDLHVDWRQISRWGISEKDVPADALVQFKEPTFWERYRNETVATIVVILLQAGLIVMLLIERRARRRTATALEESQKQLNLAARAARLHGIWDAPATRLGRPRIGGKPQPTEKQLIAFDDVRGRIRRIGKNGPSRKRL